MNELPREVRPSLLHRVLDLRTGEGRPTLGLAANGFFIAVAAAALERAVASRHAHPSPIAFGALLPVSVLASVAVYFVALRRYERLPPSLIVAPITLVALVVGVIVAWGHNVVSGPRLAIGLLALISSALIFVLHLDAVARVTVLFDERRGLRLVPLVSCGVIAGAAFGWLSVRPVLRAFDVAGAMGFGAIFVLAGMLMTLFSSPRLHALARVDDDTSDTAPTPSAGYLALVAVLVGVGDFANGATEAHWEAWLGEGPARLAASQSTTVWLVGKGLSMLVLLFVLGRWLQRFGAPRLLLVAPAVGVMTSLPFLFMSSASAKSLWWVGTPAESIRVGVELAAVCILYFRVGARARLPAQIAIAALVGGGARVCGHGLHYFWTPEDPRMMWLVITASWVVVLLAALGAGRAFSRRDMQPAHA